MLNIVKQLIGPVTGVLEKVIPDRDLRDKLAHEISTMAEKHANEIAKSQIEVNKVEAAGNWFQASWRPLCGYVCVLGLAINFLVSPVAAAFQVNVPQADMGEMMPILLGMLGLGAMRTYERKQGVGK
jgi:hypothetical protein